MTKEFKITILFAITLSGLLAVSSLFAANSKGSIHVRVAAYNVEFGKNASPEEIGKMLSEFVTRVESTEAGASGLVFQYFTSSTLAYSLNFFEYGGCDPYFSLPNCIWWG